MVNYDLKWILLDNILIAVLVNMALKKTFKIVKCKREKNISNWNLLLHWGNIVVVWNKYKVHVVNKSVDGKTTIL